MIGRKFRKSTIKLRKSRRKLTKKYRKIRRKISRKQQYGKGPDECGICLEDKINDDDKYTLQCKHKFHKSCLNRWCWRNSSSCTCPICRAIIPNGIIPPNPSQTVFRPASPLDLVADNEADSRRFARWGRISPPPQDY